MKIVFHTNITPLEGKVCPEMCLFLSVLCYTVHDCALHNPCAVTETADHSQQSSQT